ncbi:SET domain-containing protein SmydA-8-like isoform X2 [Macrobrachium nipponense]|uniref:SET domain-containing protein SmydA-8-like isoform X2 n=1 Tax=Macrobrachium nipponense TaxID=159736 RepID=UPI0030C85916
MALYENTSISNGSLNYTGKETSYTSESDDPYGIGIFKEYMLKLLPYNEAWIKNATSFSGTTAKDLKVINKGTNGSFHTTNGYRLTPANKYGIDEAPSTNGTCNGENHVNDAPSTYGTCNGENHVNEDPSTYGTCNGENHVNEAPSTYGTCNGENHVNEAPSTYGTCNGENHVNEAPSTYGTCNGENHVNEAPSTNGTCNGENHVSNTQYKKSRLTSHKIYPSNIDDTAYPVEIGVSDTVGRYLKARRDIFAGEILFVEPPVAMATRPKSPPHCQNCYKQTSSFKCPDCGFFLCGPECLTDFHKTECQFLKRLGAAECSEGETTEQRIMLERLQQMPQDMRAQAMAMIERARAASKEQKHREIMQQYVVMAALRTIFLIQENEFYKRVLKAMQANLEPGSERYKMNQNLIVGVIVNRLKVFDDSELVHRICSVWDTNAFQVVLPKNGRLQGLFPLAGLMNHDCRPNAQQWFTDKGNMVVRAIDPIPRGATVSISYTDPQWSTIVRQNHLQKCKQFTCICKRCLDPTEMGTFIGSLICAECGSPMISSAPLDTSAKWVCTSCTCQHTMEAKQILSLGANLGALTQKLNPSNVSAATSLAKLLERQVHPHHYSLMQMYVSIINALVHKDLADVNDEELCRLSGIVSRVMEVTRALQSPLARITASVAREDLRLRLEGIKRAEMKSGRDGARQRLAEMSTHLSECVEVLGWDPSMPSAAPLLREYQALVNKP